MTARQSTSTVIVAMAVLLLTLAGCPTKRDIRDIDADLAMIRQQNENTQQAIARIDSLIAVNAQADLQLRSDINSSVEDLQRQLAQLLENYNSLMMEINRLRSNRQQTKVADEAVADRACSQSFDGAVALLRDKKYDDAITGFRTYLVACSTHASVGDAQYWIGECLFSQLKFENAIGQFEMFMKDYPKSTRIAQSIYKVGRSYQELGKKAEAKKRFQEVVKEFPNTLEAKQSQERLKELK